MSSGPDAYLTPDGLEQQYFQSSHVMNGVDFGVSSCMKSLANKIIAGEIGAVNGNGEYNSSFDEMLNRYWDGFWWMDAAGVVSKIGQKAGLRWLLYQSGGTENSVNKNLLGYDFKPNPDYFTSLLYKNLMGVDVLQIESDNNYLRIYSQCTSPRINGYIYGENELKLKNPVSINYVTLFTDKEYDYVNIYIDMMEDLVLGEVILFSLTPGDESDDIESTTMKLNGNVLELEGGKLPSLKGKVIEVKDGYVQVPAYRYGFIVFTQTNIDACKL